MKIEVNPYLIVAINSFFSGMGVVVAHHVYDLYFRHRITKLSTKLKRIHKKITR